MDKIINDQYLIIRQIGGGKYVSVYKAWDSMLQKIVAVRKISKDYVKNPESIGVVHKRLINTAKLEHENIVRVVNFIKNSEGDVYLIMDYVMGIGLDDLLKKCSQNSIKIQANIVLYVMQEILKALDYAYSLKDELTGKLLKVLHYDICSSNIMLYFNGRIKLTGFGIARIGQDLGTMSEKDKLTERLAYMSPEQVEMSGNIDERSDLFSCGTLLYELLSGEKAFTGINELNILRKIRKAEIDFSKLQEAKIDNELQKIVKKSLQKSPDDRYRSPAEMFLDIKRYSVRNLSAEGKKDEFTEFLSKNVNDDIKERRQEMEKDSKLDFRELMNVAIREISS